jgi:hypothetical protein
MTAPCFRLLAAMGCVPVFPRALLAALQTLKWLGSSQSFGNTPAPRGSCTSSFFHYPYCSGRRR